MRRWLRRNHGNRATRIMILLLTAEERAPVNEFILSRPIRDDQTLRHFKQIETHETYCFKFMRHAKHIRRTYGQGNYHQEVIHEIRAEEFVVKETLMTG